MQIYHITYILINSSPFYNLSIIAASVFKFRNLFRKRKLNAINSSINVLWLPYTALELIPWSRVLKLTVFQVFKNFFTPMEHECPFLYSYKTATDLFPKPDESSSHPTSLRGLLILFFHVGLGLADLFTFSKWDVSWLLLSVLCRLLVLPDAFSVFFHPNVWGISKLETKWEYI